MANARFDDVYNGKILGREFVEFRDYYQKSRRRYHQVWSLTKGLNLPAGSSHLDIGGGQMAILCQDTLGFDSSMADVVEDARGDVESSGIAFERINLMDDQYETSRKYDVITMLEVIEHIPVPPYIVLEKLATLLKPNGWLVLTTPNGFRIRNVLRMLANVEVLGIYRYPDGDEALGHQHEYSLRQMQWQIEHAGFRIETLKTYQSGWQGSSLKARLLHAVTSPFALFPHLRDGLIGTMQFVGKPTL